MSVEDYLFDGIAEFFSEIGESIKEARLELERRRHIEAVNNFKGDIKTQHDIITSNISNEKSNLKNVLEDVKSLADKVKKHSNIDCCNSTIKKKIEQILNKTDKLVAEVTEKVNQRLAELEEIESQMTTLYKNSLDSEDEAYLSELRKSIRKLSKASKPTEFSSSYVEIGHLDNVLEILDNVNDAIKSMSEEKGEVIKEYITKITSLLETVDIFNINSVNDFVAKFNDINKEFKAELLMEQSKSKIEADQEKLQGYFDIIEQIDSTIKSIDLQDYLITYDSLKQRAEDLLKRLTEIESVSIANRKLAIEKQITKYVNPNNFTKDDFDNYIKLLDELELLVQENTLYSAKKALFEAYYERYKKAAVEAFQPVDDLAFDFETCDQQIQYLIEATDALYQMAYLRKYQAAVDVIQSEFLIDGFIELKGESQEDEISTRKVFYKKDNPFIAVLVDIMPSSRILVRTVPLVIKYRGKYVCLENNEELLNKITRNCKAIHRDNVDHITDKTELDEISYFELSEEAAREYCQALGIDLSTIVSRGTVISIKGASSQIVEETTINTLNAKDGELFIDK